MTDLISRKDVIDMLQRLSNDKWNKGAFTSWANAYEECAEMISDLPTIDSVKHGKWVSKNGWVHCSVCGLEPPNESNEISEYCSNCGARMDM